MYLCLYTVNFNWRLSIDTSPEWLELGFLNWVSLSRQVPRAGCLMTYSGSGDHPSPVVLLKVEDTVKASAVNVKTRERIVVRRLLVICPA